jgi:hypothetical protein
MSDVTSETDQSWPTHCSVCGTELVSATVDFDKTNADRPEMRPGEMAAVDYCPNAECPANKPGGPGSLPGSLGGDNGGA